MRPVLLSWLTVAALATRALAQDAGAPAPSPPSAAASDDQAQRLSDEAVEAYKAGKFDLAIRLYRQAYDLRKDPTLLYNRARVYDKMGKVDRALEYYRRYLISDGTDPKLRARAEDRVAALNGAPPPPGQRPAQPPAVAAPAQPPPPRVVHVPGPGRTLLWAGVGLGAAGVAGLVVGVGLYGAAASQYSTFGSTTDELDKRAARDSAQALGLGSVVGYAVAGALLAGGAVLISLGVKKGVRETTRVALCPAPDGGRLMFSGAF